MTYKAFAVRALPALILALVLAACSGPRGPNPGPAGGSQLLTLHVEGPGAVYIEKHDLECRDECEIQVGAGVELELEARADAGNGFAGWQGACSGSNTRCTLPMDVDRTVRASFAEHVLSLTFSGDGGGSVRVVPPDETCSDDCAFAFATPVTTSLTVTLEEGSLVKGWGGACSSSGKNRYCQTRVEGQTVVGIQLISPPTAKEDSYEVEDGKTLAVGAANGVLSNDSDRGGGTLTAELADGPDKGALDFRSDGSFTYQAHVGASGGDSFSYRARDSEGNLSAVTGVSIAIKQRQTHSLTVDVSGSGSGSVTSDPSGINCPGDCNEAYPEGSQVTLTAKAGSGSTFGGWGGECSGAGGNTCTVSMTAAKQVTASFAISIFTLEYQEAAGQGTVTFSPPGGPGCTTDCSNSYGYGEEVILTATPAQGYEFGGWGGACADSSGSQCELLMTGNQQVSASFETVPEQSLTVGLSGSGSGSVTSSPAGIDCPGDCSETYPEGSQVTLTARASSGSTFSGWGGACSTAQGTECQLTMTGDTQVTAEFTPLQHPLTVTVNGGGNVSSTPAGINCPSDCGETFGHGTDVTLTAQTPQGWSFTGWGGACGGSAETCSVLMDGAKEVTANFEATTQTVSYDEAAGEGNVSFSPTGNPSNPACSSDCTKTYTYGTQLTLAAQGDSGYDFERWGGACSSESSSQCSLLVESDLQVSASFSPSAPAESSLTVQLAGNGDGRVVSDPEGIDCSGWEEEPDCHETFPQNSQITLSASEAAGSSFVGWDGCEPADSSTCSFELAEDRTVTASFAVQETEEEGSLALAFIGEGLGKVTLDPPEGDQCRDDCVRTYPMSTALTLTAVPDDSNDFTGWGGDCSDAGQQANCELLIDGEKSVTVAFEASQQ